MFVLCMLVTVFVACSTKKVDTGDNGAVIQNADSTAVVDSTKTQ